MKIETVLFRENKEARLIKVFLMEDKDEIIWESEPTDSYDDLEIQSLREEVVMVAFDNGFCVAVGSDDPNLWKICSKLEEDG